MKIVNGDTIFWSYVFQLGCIVDNSSGLPDPLDLILLVCVHVCLCACTSVCFCFQQLPPPVFFFFFENCTQDIGTHFSWDSLYSMTLKCEAMKAQLSYLKLGQPGDVELNIFALECSLYDCSPTCGTLPDISPFPSFCTFSNLLPHPPLLFFWGAHFLNKLLIQESLFWGMLLGNLI